MYARSPPCASCARRSAPEPGRPMACHGGADGRSPVRKRADRPLGPARRLRGAAGGSPRPRASPAHTGRDRLPDRPARRAGPRAGAGRARDRWRGAARDPGPAGRPASGAPSPARRCGPLHGRVLRGEPRPGALRPHSHRRGRTPRLRRTLGRVGSARGRTDLAASSTKSWRTVSGISRTCSPRSASGREAPPRPGSPACTRATSPPRAPGTAGAS